MRSLCLIVAALVVLVTNGLGIWQSSRNRAEALGGTLELTEHEVPLMPADLESSVTILRLKWKTERKEDDRWGPAVWLTSEKLAELGFDCSVAIDSPRAVRHYESTPARRVFLALEYQPPHADTPDSTANRHSGLMVVDAAADPETLRRRHPDPKRLAISRGAVRIGLRRHDSQGGPLDRPELVGWVEGLVPSQVFVPRPANQLLTTLRGAPTAPEPENAPTRAPRYSARVHWGLNYEPWVEEVIPLSSP